jgi:hypothetical protein
MTHLNSRVARIVAGLAVVSAFAVAPMVAQAADVNATGTLGAGELTNTAPSIGSLSTTLTGVSQIVNADVGTWSVTDARGTDLGYNVTLAATAPTVGAVAAAAGTGGSLTLTKSDATAMPGNSAPQGPTPSAGATMVLGAAASIAGALPTDGQGAWEFAAVTDGLSVVIPGDAKAGAYSSTLTYTASPLA